MEKAPMGSRLEKYLEELPDTIKRDGYDGFLSFFTTLFMDCLDFLIQENTDISYIPKITLKLVHTHEQFKKEEQREIEHSESKENAKNQARAFVVGNTLRAQIYVDLATYDHIITKYGMPSFLLDLASTYFHELLHTMFPQKYEQAIYELQHHLVETFLGIELSKETKSLKSSDYYIKKEKGREG